MSKDYANANGLALQKWRQTFGDALGIALTDTFGTEAFLRNFKGDLARQYSGVRQDSGDPERFVDRIVKFYRDEGIDPTTKVCVFSDGLSVDKCLVLKRYAEKKGIQSSFGIGTHLSSKQYDCLSSHTDVVR